MNKSLEYRLWIIFFFYTAFVSLFIQLILLPYFFSSWHAGNGLLTSSLDSLSFHKSAVDLAQKIHVYGWSVWELRPKGQSPVGVVAAIYALTTAKPWVLIPLSAFLHATAAIILLKMILLFLPDWKKAIWCVLPFVFYPTAALWYAQIHKDGYSILGLLMIIYGLIILSKHIFIRKEYLKLTKGFLIILFGTFLIWLVRPYLMTYTNMLTCLFISIVFGFLIFMFFKKNIRIKTLSLNLFLFILLILLLSPENIFSWTFKKFEGTKTITQDLTKSNKNIAGPISPSHETKGAIPTTTTNVTDKARAGFIANNVIKINLARTGFIMANHAVDAKSAIDNNINFNTLSDVISYIPRALQIVFLSPFPTDWFKQGTFESNTLMRRITGVEMLGVYFSLIFLPFAAFYWRKQIEFWLVILFCTILLLLLGLIINNIGTLCRFRYGLLMTIVALGVAGFIKLLEVKSKK